VLDRLKLARFADKIEPLRSIRGFRAEGIEHLDFFKARSERREDASHRKGLLVDRFVDQSVPITFFMFEDVYPPGESISLSASHFDNGQIPVKPFFPGVALDETLQFANSVHVEDEQTPVVKMPRYTAKGLFPIRKTDQMIDRVEYADDRIEALRNAKVSYLLPEETRVPEPLSRDREHRPRSIEAGDFVGFGEDPQNGTSAAGDLKHRPRVGLVIGDEPRDVPGCIRSVAHDQVVKPVEFVVGHSIILDYVLFYETKPSRYRIQDAPILAAAERETARTPGLLVSRPDELELKAFKPHG
jgi:hypothetical protein